MYSKVGAKDADLLVIGKRKISRKRKLFICVLFVATVLTGMSVFEKMNAPAPLPVDTSVKIVATMPKPESGAPTDYSAYENFCIAAGVLNDASYFRADTDGTIIASVFGAPYNQKLEGHRVQKDGRLFHEVNSTSTMKSVGEQRFFADDAILMRTAKYKKGVPNWGSIGLVQNDDFSAKYGIIPREICLYVVNEDTVLESGFVSEDSGLTTYYMVLDPVTAPERYKRQVGALGGANDYPVFKSIKLTFTIDSDWVIQYHTVEETYDISIAGLGAMTCRAAMTETFSDIGADLDFPEEAQDFLTLAPDSVGGLDDAPVMGASDYLAEAFGGYLGGDTIKFAANVNALGLNLPLKGYIDIANMDIRVGVGDILYAAYRNDAVYVKSGDGKVKIPVSSLTPVIEELKPILSDAGVDLSQISSLLEGDLIGTLFGESDIEENGDDVHILMPFSLMNIGFDIDMHLKKAGGKFYPYAINATLDLKELGLDKFVKPADGEYKVKVGLNFTSEELPAPDDDYPTLDLSFIKDFIAPVKNMISANAYSFGGEINVSGTKIEIANAQLVRGESVTLKAQIKVMGITADIKFADNTVYVSVGNVNLKAAAEDFPALIDEIIPLIPDGDKIISAVEETLASVKNVSVPNILETALKFLPTLTYGEGTLGVDIGGVKANVTPAQNGISLNLPEFAVKNTTVSANLSLTAIAEKTDPVTVGNADAYVSLTDVIPYVKPIMTLLSSESFRASVSGTVESADLSKYLDSTVIDGELAVNIGKKGGLALQAALTAFTHKLELAFNGETAYVSLNDLINLSLNVNNFGDILSNINEALPDGKKVDVAAVNGYLDKIINLDLGSLVEFDEKTISTVIGSIRSLEYKDGALTVMLSFGDITVTASIVSPSGGAEALTVNLGVNFAPADASPIDINLALTLYDFSDETLVVNVADSEKYVASKAIADFIKPVINTIRQEKFDISFSAAVDGTDESGAATSTVISGELKIIPTSEITNASFPEMYVALSLGDKTNPTAHNLKLLIEKDAANGEIEIYANYNGMKIHLGYTAALKIVGAVCDMLKIKVPMIDNLTSGVYTKGELQTDIFDDATIAGLTEKIEAINGIFQVVDGGKSAFDELIEKVLFGALNEALRSVSLSMESGELKITVENSLLERIMSIVSGNGETRFSPAENNLGTAEISLKHSETLLSSLNVTNLAVNGSTIALSVELNDATDMTLPKSSDTDFDGAMDFDSLYDLIASVINTANARTFPISGQIALSGIASATIYFDLNVAIVDNPNYDPTANNPEPKTKVLVGLKTYSNLSTVSLAGIAIDKADSYLYFDGENIYVQRDDYKSSWFKWVYSSSKYCKLTTEEFGKYAMDVIFDIIPLSNTVKNQISTDGSNGGTMNYANILTAFSKSGDTTSLTVNLKELAGSSALGNLDVNLTEKSVDEKTYVHKVDGNTSIAAGIIKAKFNATLKNVDESNLTRGLDDIAFGYLNGSAQSAVSIRFDSPEDRHNMSSYNDFLNRIASLPWKSAEEVYGAE